jgi:carboxymethylenebutenolidase
MPEARIEIELDDGVLDAFVACPATPGRRPPILLLPDRLGVTAQVESRARRLSAHNYFVLTPALSGRSAEDRREAAEACLDHLADERRVDDGRVGVLGFGAGADLAIRLAAARAERIAAVAAFGGRGFGPRTSREIASRINGVVHIGHTLGVTPARVGALETALCEAGVDFDVELGAAEPDWSGLLDFFARALQSPTVGPPTQPQHTAAVLNP